MRNPAEETKQCPAKLCAVSTLQHHRALCPKPPCSAGGLIMLAEPALPSRRPVIDWLARSPMRTSTFTDYSHSLGKALPPGRCRAVGARADGGRR